MKHRTPQSLFSHVLTLAVVAVLLTPWMSAQSSPARRIDGSHWIGTWATSAQQVEAQLHPAPGLADVTVRQVVRVSTGGKQLRVRFSNAFASPGNMLVIKAAHIAVSAGADAIKPESIKALAFHGQPDVTIPAGAVMISDPIDFDLAPGSDLAVTIHLENAVKEVTGHRGARCDVYTIAGNCINATSLPDAAVTKAWYYLCGVDVLAPESTGAVICLGDSITDGRGATDGTNRRWPDFLARRLQANASTRNVGVLNQGIGGNSLWAGGIGQPAIARLERDVLAQPGARWLIVFEGINDLGGGKTSAAQIIATYEQIIMRARDRGLRVYGATILPCAGSNYITPEAETARLKINAWMRTSGAFDAVIDFEAAVQDPADPSRLLKVVDSGDHLHLSDEGYRMLAEAVSLDLFRN